MEFLYTLGIILFALSGVALSGYIAKRKNQGASMVCPLGHSCESIINGRFSRFLGLRVEFIGLSYYLFVALFYIASLFVDIPQKIIFLILLITGISFAFTLYLLIVQLMVIKKWCSTCLGSSAVSFLIIVLSFLGFESSFGDYLFSYHDVMEWVFVGSIVVGTLSTSLYARTFIKFLKDFEISKQESDRLNMLSHTSWVAVAFTFLSGLGLVLTDIYGNFTESSSFIVTLVLLGVVLAYEIIVNMFLGHRLIDIHFGKREESDEKHLSLRKTSFAFLAVGVISWYVLLLLNTVSFYGYSSGFLLVVYLILIIIGVFVALFAEHLFSQKSQIITVEEDHTANQ